MTGIIFTFTPKAEIDKETFEAVFDTWTYNIENFTKTYSVDKYKFSEMLIALRFNLKEYGIEGRLECFTNIKESLPWNGSNH